MKKQKEDVLTVEHLETARKLLGKFDYRPAFDIEVFKANNPQWSIPKSIEGHCRASGG